MAHYQILIKENNVDRTYAVATDSMMLERIMDLLWDLLYENAWSEAQDITPPDETPVGGLGWRMDFDDHEAMMDAYMTIFNKEVGRKIGKYFYIRKS